MLPGVTTWPKSVAETVEDKILADPACRKQWQEVSSRFALVFANPEVTFKAMNFDAVLHDAATRKATISRLMTAPASFGDLRGAKYLFNTELKGRITHFISVDGLGTGTTNAGVGSNRYRVTFKGPGGHSYGAFGLPSPIHALGRAIEKIARFEVPKTPKTTFTVGRIEGGTSVNAIAHTAWMEVDMRSESAAALAKVDAQFQQAIKDALQEENEFWHHEQKLTVEVTLVGQRPVGDQPADAPIVKAAMAADTALGLKSLFSASSTDANIPMSLNIPAITVGGGGIGRDAHALSESFETTNSHVGTQRVLLITLNVVGLK